MYKSLRTELILLFAALFFGGCNIYSQEWRYIGFDSPSSVFSFCADEELLYIGGGFINYNSQPMNGICVWDSTIMHNLKSGVDGAVFTLSQFDNKIVVGGTFGQVDTLQDSENLIAWNGDYWERIGDGYPSSRVYSSETLNDVLYIGGDYSYVGLTNIIGVAKCEFGDWSLAGATNNTEKAMCIYNSELIVAGEFTFAGGQYAPHIASFNGAEWSSLGLGVDNYIRCLAVDTINNFLYAGGAFNFVDDSILSYKVAYWDGYKWNSVSTGLVDEIYGMVFYRGNLYVGGFHIDVGFPNAITLAVWNGNSWDTIDGAPNETIMALEVFKDELYIGGNIDTVNENISYGLTSLYMPSGYNCNMLSPRVFCNLDTVWLNQGTADIQFYNNNAYCERWSWDFGDGGTDTVQNPIHTFQADSGETQVCITVEYEGCVKDTCRTITILNGTNIPDISDLKEKFVIYPNPTKAGVTIEAEIPEGHNGSVVIYGLTGYKKKDIVLNSGKNSSLINTNNWTSGTYVCNLVVDKKVVAVKKLIIQ